MKSLTKFMLQHYRQIAHEGFAHGAQHGVPDNALLELDAQVNQEKADVKHTYVHKTKALQGQRDYLQQVVPEITNRWREVQQRIGDHCPPLVMPLVLIAGGIFALLAEGIMLAPSLDPYGVVNPLDQYIFAFGISFASSIFFHYAFDAMHGTNPSSIKRWLVSVFSAGAGIALVFFGIVRGRQIAFAAELSENPVGAFLGRYPILTSIVFVCLTLGFPIAAALATTNGLEKVRLWRQFTSVRRDFSSSPRELAHIAKQLEAEEEKLEHQLSSLEEKRKRWRHEYLVNHEKGDLYGAKQMAMWMVWLKSFAVALVVFCLTFPTVIVSAFVTSTAFLLAWIYFYYERVHPKSYQQFAHQNIQFRAVDETHISETPLSGHGIRRKRIFSFSKKKGDPQ